MIVYSASNSFLPSSKIYTVQIAITSSHYRVCLIEFPSIQVLKLAAKSLLARTLRRPHFEGPPVIVYLSADLSGERVALIVHSTRSEQQFIIIDTSNDVCSLLNGKIHYRSTWVVHRNGGGNKVHFLGSPNATGFNFEKKNLKTSTVEVHRAE